MVLAPGRRGLLYWLWKLASWVRILLRQSLAPLK
jgi:hypothetical protein